MNLNWDEPYSVLSYSVEIYDDGTYKLKYVLGNLPLRKVSSALLDEEDKPNKTLQFIVDSCKSCGSVIVT